MDDFKGLYMALWSAPGYYCSWRAFILAGDNVEAEYLWRGYLKEHKEDASTWEKGRRNCCTHALIRPAEAREVIDFERVCPGRLEKGVYRREIVRHSAATDHVWD